MLVSIFCSKYGDKAMTDDHPSIKENWFILLVYLLMLKNAIIVNEISLFIRGRYIIEFYRTFCWHKERIFLLFPFSAAPAGAAKQFLRLAKNRPIAAHTRLLGPCLSSSSGLDYNHWTRFLLLPYRSCRREFWSTVFPRCPYEVAKVWLKKGTASKSNLLDTDLQVCSCILDSSVRGPFRSYW